MDFALGIVVLLKGYHFDNGDWNRRVIGDFGSTEGAL